MTNNVGHSTADFISVLGMADDVLRATIPISTTVVRSNSYSALGVGIAVTLAYTVWIYHRTGKRMDSHMFTNSAMIL